MDTAWYAVLVAGEPPVAGREPTMTITDDGVVGTAGCNKWGADSIAVSWGALELGGVGIHQVACDNEQLANIERRFYDAVWQADRIRLDSGRLIVSGPGGEVVFEPDDVGNL